jgi:hypothetical protein
MDAGAKLGKRYSSSVDKIERAISQLIKAMRSSLELHLHKGSKITLGLKINITPL